MRPHAFPRARRIKRRRLIRPLFDRSRSDVERVGSGSVQILYRAVPREATGHDVPLQAGFAPGRRAKTNAGRTRLRRLLRETFRLHQGPLVDRFDGRPDCLTLFVLFRGDEETAPDAIRRDLPRAIARLAEREIRPAAVPDASPGGGAPGARP